MQVTITLTDQELKFLQNIQYLINKGKISDQKQCSLEDIIHECIKTAISLGVSMQQKGQA